MSEQISVGLIKPSPYQPRLSFDLEDIRGSIEKDGILVALTVRKKDGFYELVDGERRLRLAKELGYKTVKCNVIDVSDDVARRMVWKVNTLRKDYTPKEKAYHFKKLQEKYGMSVTGIGRDCDYDRHTVLAYLNVFKLPNKYQNLVWDGKIGIAHIRELESLFNGEYSHHITDYLNQSLERKLSSAELRQTLRPELEEIERRRVESAKKAVGKITTEIKEPETPEELEKAAQILKKEAKKRQTKEQVLEQQQKKADDALSAVWNKIQKAKKMGIEVTAFLKKYNNATLTLYPTPKKATIQETNEVWQEAKGLKKNLDTVIKEEKKRREEEERKKREEEIKRQAEEETKEKLLKDKEFIKEVAKIAPQIRTEPQETQLPFDIPSVDQQLDKIFSSMAKVTSDSKVTPNPQDFIQYIKGYIKRKKLVCPVCGETHLMWKCGHAF